MLVAWRYAAMIGCLLCLPMRAHGIELTVLSAGAITAVAKAVTPEFEAVHGATVVLRTDTVGGLVRRITSGEAFDVVLMSPAGLAQLEKAGKVVADTAVALARVGIGVGVKSGSALPDIGSVEAFRQALLAAPAIAYVDPASGGTSGIYLANLFRTLGIADALAPKSVLVKGGLVAETLLDGRATLALQQISEILSVPGVTLVGPLPAPVQAYTTYSGALAADSRHADAGRRFLATMTGTSARAAARAHGMNEP